MAEYKVIQGECLEILKKMKGNTIQCCITSPPYYGLRDYGTAKWVGGDINCGHTYQKGGRNPETLSKQLTNKGTTFSQYEHECKKCGAIRIDNQIGLEKTPEEYISKLVEVFREVRRVLKDDGTLWLNIGDSYWGGKGSNGSSKARRTASERRYLQSAGTVMIDTRPTDRNHPVIKPKDLIGIPWMLAFALRTDGWYLRQDIIWAKNNPMPESVRDRCTKSHEYIFLLSKSKKYYFDYKAIQEPAVSKSPEKESTRGEGYGKAKGIKNNPDRDGGFSNNGYRNKRSVWFINTKPYKGAHFATFPPELIRPCIKAGSKEGDIILDPFAGSGTTGQVALEEKRNTLLIELNKEYIDLIHKRLK